MKTKITLLAALCGFAINDGFSQGTYFEGGLGNGTNLAPWSDQTATFD